ncbi:MAG: DUF995 domain-containing protein [Alphaproteobacteria bacterium]|nr:DUF995 domain-containing protein [Alphaproteobacteria bacterium]MBU0796068.1 DUF995 domain-containing protein [Alphaproteobacteria bacterium]MBU1814484.1 DUF995 domain-containing protein [Alphaproteobacteria bacterium]MBU2089247.1 DUF995 domain-containing protein [Alphaproteobacteria bacterium]
MKKFLLCASVLAVSACAGQPEPLGPPVTLPSGPALTGAEVRSLVVGNTATGQMSGSQATYTMYVAPGGAAELKRPTGIEKGVWQITQDGQLCMKWELFRDSENYCQNVYREGAVYKFRNNTSVELLTIAPGRKL